jgi:hypothetical protein
MYFLAIGVRDELRDDSVVIPFLDGVKVFLIAVVFGVLQESALSLQKTSISSTYVFGSSQDFAKRLILKI